MNRRYVYMLQTYELRKYVLARNTDVRVTHTWEMEATGADEIYNKQYRIKVGKKGLG